MTNQFEPEEGSKLHIVKPEGFEKQPSENPPAKGNGKKAQPKKNLGKKKKRVK